MESKAPYLAPNIEDVIGHDEGAPYDPCPNQCLEGQAAFVQVLAGVLLFSAPQQDKEVGSKENKVPKADSQHCAFPGTVSRATIHLRGGKCAYRFEILAQCPSTTLFEAEQQAACCI